jgi:DNA-binding transcriptional MerR regulator
VTPVPTLSIGDLARATGVTTATLRAWESRHGFPRPLRLRSGHRRYSQDHVAAVLDVQRRRDAGIRLDIAIRQVLTDAERVERPAVFATVSAKHPSLPRQSLHQPTMLQISQAIEDEVVATAAHAHLFASFQTTRNYLASRDRWEELARGAASVHVFADFGVPGGVEQEDGPGPVRVTLDEHAPMRREWTVICDGPELPVALIAWETPGQAAVVHRDRVFEVMWSVDPTVVRDAARHCAEAAAAAGSRRAAELVAGPLSGPPTSLGPTPLATSRLALRILGRLDVVARRG